jgi:hypothetical protein
VSERFVRKVSRITLDWSVQAQSVIDRELRHRQKAVRRLRKTDPGLGEELRAALADGVVETDDWPQRSARWFALVLEAGAAGLRKWFVGVRRRSGERTGSRRSCSWRSSSIARCAAGWRSVASIRTESTRGRADPAL